MGDSFNVFGAVDEAKRRGLDCGVESSAQVAKIQSSATLATDLSDSDLVLLQARDQVPTER